MIDDWQMVKTKLSPELHLHAATYLSIKPHLTLMPAPVNTSKLIVEVLVQMQVDQRIIDKTRYTCSMMINCS